VERRGAADAFEHSEDADAVFAKFKPMLRSAHLEAAPAPDDTASYALKKLK
jgi:hypothetical protein